jgi:hypothetical protein
LNLVVIATIIVAVVAVLSIAVSANAFTWYSYNYAGNYGGIPSNYQYRYQGPTRQTPQQFPPINHFQFPFNQQFPPIIIPPLPPITFPNQFPFNFNGQPIPIPPIPPIQFPQITQQNYPNSVSQNTQCNNGSCTIIICTNGGCETQTSTGSTVSVTTQCINGVCTTTYH